jgi:pimeloyl-ACP methyl ester carboxylesterase
VKSRPPPIDVVIGPRALAGLLRVPAAPGGLVVFAHGSGSSRLSRRNNFVAEALGRAGLATLLFDLLTEEEGLDRRNVFDVALLGARMLEALDWARARRELAPLPVGLFGASTGAAAALIAAAERPAAVQAVVSRGGRPDLAGEALARVRAPTLLIVGGADYGVIELNEAAARSLGGEHALVLVPGATHLFEEPGALEAVVEQAAAWFRRHLQSSAAA